MRVASFVAVSLALAFLTAVGCSGQDGISIGGQSSNGGSSPNQTPAPPQLFSMCKSGMLGQAVTNPIVIPEGCSVVEGHDLGIVPFNVTVGDKTVTITGYTPKWDNPWQFTGFEFTSTGNVAFMVKSDYDLFVGTGYSWEHPAEVETEWQFILKIIFCPRPDPEPLPEEPVDAGTPPEETVDAGSPEVNEPTDAGSPDDTTQPPPAVIPPENNNLPNLNAPPYEEEHGENCNSGPRGPGNACLTSADCGSQLCLHSVCAPSLEGGPCISDQDCGLPFLTCVDAVCSAGVE